MVNQQWWIDTWLTRHRLHGPMVKWLTNFRLSVVGIYQKLFRSLLWVALRKSASNTGATSVPSESTEREAIIGEGLTRPEWPQPEAMPGGGLGWVRVRSLGRGSEPIELRPPNGFSCILSALDGFPCYDIEQFVHAVQQESMGVSPRFASGESTPFSAGSDA